MKKALFGLLLALPALLSAQQISIRVDAANRQTPFAPVWSYFGYDEPNYTYTDSGRKLIRELSDMSRSPVHIRTHNLLTTGNGIAALKWGSTNAYTEDASGKPVYDWGIVDKILSTYLDAGVKPLVEIGFMPKALSTHPEPYQHTFPKGDVFTGWSYPPTSYDKWGELVFQLVKHCIAKYGKAEAASWDWEVWNEPDIPYWHGTAEEYDKLYDVTSAAVRRALPEARVGGPASTSPGNPKAAAFLRQFLQHCTDRGTPLDFISFHAKGSPETADGHLNMGLAHEMKDVESGFTIVHSFEKFRSLPVILSEADPEGCAGCSARTNPKNAYRNGTLYPAYEAVAVKTILQLAKRQHINLQGILTWAFEFEDQPYFDGLRTLATNGIDKPVLNVFRMLGLMHGEVVPTESDGAVPPNEILNAGVRGRADVDALAVRSDHQINVLAWNYRDEDVSAPAAPIQVHVAGIPANIHRVLLQHFRIDQSHSNAYTVWKQQGSPARPDAEQYARMEKAGQLQLLESPQWISVNDGTADVHLSLPLQALSLMQLSW